jgi:hypothetical protein
MKKPNFSETQIFKPIQQPERLLDSGTKAEEGTYPPISTKFAVPETCLKPLSIWAKGD